MDDTDRIRKAKIQAAESTAFPELSGQPRIGSQVLDWDGFMARVMGDQALALEIFTEFLTLTPARIKKLAKSLEQMAFSTAAMEAHTLRGACGTVGAVTLEALAIEAEKAAKARDCIKLQHLARELEAGFCHLASAWQKATGPLA